jgi:TP901 family phage tail tape measure protein
MAGGRFGGHAATLGLLSPTMAAAGGAGLGLALATKEAAELDKAVIQAASNMKGFTDQAKADLTELALRLSEKFPQAAEEIAKSFKQMKESGYDAQQTLSHLPKFMQFATAHGEELGSSVEHVTSAIRAFGLEGKTEAENLKILTRTMDLITAMNKEGGASAVELAQSLSAVGQKASQLGMNMEQAAAAVTVLNKQNIDGSRAGEVLTRFLIVVSSAFEKNTSKWREMGIQIHDANNKLKPFPELIN